MKTNYRYTKIPFTDAERVFLQEQAKAKGMRLSRYIRECLFNERSYEINFDQSMIEEHTKALVGVREELKEIIYRAPLEDKILLSGFFNQMHIKMCAMETDEAKIRRDIRQIKTILQREKEDGEEEGEASANVSV